MKRTLMGGLVLAACLGVPAMSAATPVPEAQQNCGQADNAGPVHVAAGQPTGDSARVTVCNDDADFPLEGIIGAQADASSQCAVVWIDGDPENPYLDFDMDDGGNLDGYAALEIDADSATPVGVEESENHDYRVDCATN